MGSLKPGSRVWTRHLVSVTLGPDGNLIPEASYSTEYPRPASVMDPGAGDRLKALNPHLRR